MSRAPGLGRFESPLRPVELFVLTGDPEFDDDVKEWKATAIPVRLAWGWVSGGGDWEEGGHRGESGVVKRWRRENEERESTVWFPSEARADDSEEGDETTPPNVQVDQRVYVSQIDGHLHVLQAANAFVKGKLKSALLYNNAAGVEMTVWRGKPASATSETLEGVIADELILTSGQIDEDAAVHVTMIDGRWTVINVACDGIS